jgi:hypothetical protein
LLARARKGVTEFAIIPGIIAVIIAVTSEPTFGWSLTPGTIAIGTSSWNCILTHVIGAGITRDSTFIVERVLLRRICGTAIVDTKFKTLATGIGLRVPFAFFIREALHGTVNISTTTKLMTSCLGLRRILFPQFSIIRQQRRIGDPVGLIRPIVHEHGVTRQ